MNAFRPESGVTVILLKILIFQIFSLGRAGRRADRNSTTSATFGKSRLFQNKKLLDMFKSLSFRDMY